MVTYSISNIKFCLRDGVEVRFMKWVKFPALIANKSLLNVVNNQILLFQSGASMKRARQIWDFLSDTAVTLHEIVKLVYTSATIVYKFHICFLIMAIKRSFFFFCVHLL